MSKSISYTLTMNPEAQALLEEILKKEPRELNEEEKAFLRSRVSYLKDSQKEEYKEVLTLETKPLEEETVKQHDKKSK